KKFIYISSLVVYEKKLNNYKMTKLYCESMVKKLSSDHLILRCPAILSYNMRKNNLLKLIEDKDPKLSLTPSSNFNYVLDTDIYNFITNCDATGIIDFVSSKNINLQEISSFLNKNVSFGKYQFCTPEISNKKLIGLYPKMDKTSKDVLSEFLQRRLL
ncbi:MAG TPA: hypothetical protein DEG69_15980, partial [Flavobacteriaceae bacterium]|nr:hypothetical protein [Flavobacteriaceae bacterium]